jgi:hypothetical protein
MPARRCRSIRSVASATEDWHRSWFFFIESKTEFTLPDAGRYFMVVHHPLARRAMSGGSHRSVAPLQTLANWLIFKSMPVAGTSSAAAEK